MRSHTVEPSHVIAAMTHVNGADLYYEVRGEGPPVFFVQGTTGDGGSFERVADVLADEFTVVTYHRRGNGWSPRPDGWNATTVDEQADDLAALIEALGLAPATVFGTSDGAAILLNTLIRHPEALSGAIIHEPLLEPLVAAGEEARTAIDAFATRVEAAYAAGGPRGGMEALIRAVAGDRSYEAIDPVRRERILESAATYFDMEATAFASWMPERDDLARITVPAMVAAGTVDVLGGAFRRSCEWVASLLGTTVTEFPGAHTPYLDHPEETAAVMRPFLREASGLANAASDRLQPRPLLHEVAGTGDPIVLVPGGLSGWLSWIPHARALAMSHEVIRVELRGLELAGSGQPVPDSYATATESDALLATVDALGLDRFDLAGWSLGGHVALDFTMNHPDRVRTLTVIEPAAPWILRESGYPPDELARLEEADRAMRGRRITPDDFTSFLVRAGLAQPGDHLESHPSWPVWMRNRQIVASLGMIWDYHNTLGRLRALTVPVLAVYGAASTPDEIAITRTLAKTVLTSTLLELPGDHACHLQNSEAFLAALEHHLAQGHTTAGRG